MAVLCIRIVISNSISISRRWSYAQVAHAVVVVVHFQVDILTIAPTGLVWYGVPHILLPREAGTDECESPPLRHTMFI
jgi:hypothetical protein